MTAVMRAANLALGAAMVLLGLALPFAAFIDTGHAAQTDAFRLIQFHLVLTGAASLLPVLFVRRDIFIAAPVLLVSGVNVWIGFLAVIAAAGEAALLWPLGFAAASAVSLAHLFATDVKADAEVAADSEMEAGLVAPDFGAGPDLSPLRSALVAFGAIVIIIAVTAALMFVGSIYCTLLKAAVVDRKSIDVSVIFENLSGGVANEFLLRTGAIVAAVAVVYGAMFAAEAALRGAARRKYLTGNNDFDRDLSLAEQRYVRDALKVLDDHVTARIYAGGWSRLYAAGAVAVVAALAASPFAAIFGEQFAADALKATRAGGAEPLFYSGPAFVGGAIGALFAGPLLVWAAFQYLGARQPEFGEYLFVVAGWNSANNRPRTLDEFLRPLVRFVRARMLSLVQPFDPEAFLRMAFRENESLIYAATFWACLLTAAGATADVARFRLVDVAGVTFSNYLQFTTKRVALADIDYVEVTCALLAPDDDGDVPLRVGYELVEKGVFNIDLLDRFQREPQIIDRLAELDARLAAVAIPVVRTESVGWADKRRPGYIDSCAEEIAARYDADVAPRLIRLLRAEGAVPAHDLPPPQN